MKKNVLIALLPMLMLVSCNAPIVNEEETELEPVVVENEPLPVIRGSETGTHVTYLMMSRYGYINKVNEDGSVTKQFGETYAEKYLEYAIKYLRRHSSQHSRLSSPE